MEILGYFVAYSFTYTMVSASFLKKVPIKRYQHLSTATHTFVVIYSLSCMYIIIVDVPGIVCIKVLMEYKTACIIIIMAL